MKRFYTDVSVAEAEAGFAVLLDARPMKTPGKRTVVAPNRPLAEAVAEEWRAQEETLSPATMPLARCLNSALDTVAPQPDAAVAQLRHYARSDLLCYRADEPEELAARQKAVWAPHLAWAEARFGVSFAVVAGVMPADQPPGTIETLTEAVAAMDPYRLTGTYVAAGATASVVLGLRLAERAITAEEAWTAASLDEAFQAELWGDDAEAAERRAAIAAEVRAADRFLGLLGQPDTAATP